MYYAPGGKGVRLDSHVRFGYTVPPHYDSMVAKLITGKDRREAIARMSRALSEYMITGIMTTIPFELAIMRDPTPARRVCHQLHREHARQPARVDRAGCLTREALADCRLYAFVDSAYLHGREPAELAQQLCEGGADILQLRAKDWTESEVRKPPRHLITRAAEVPLVINDHQPSFVSWARVLSSRPGGFP